jgi:glucose dehydrogenase/plastocyanin
VLRPTRTEHGSLTAPQNRTIENASLLGSIDFSFLAARRFHMKLKLILSSLFAVGAMVTSSFAMAAAIDLNACCTPGDADWPKNGANLGAQSYSSLTQVTKANVNTLGAAWMVHTSAVPATTPVASAGTTTTQQQTTPIAVNGIVYTDTPNGSVIAVDGATGVVKWKWTPTTASVGFGPANPRRGVSVGGGLVYTVASGSHVVALDQNTGAQVWAVVPTPPAGSGETTFGGIGPDATVYYNGMVYIGAANSGRNAGIALNATNGALVWYFFGGAKPGLSVTDVNGKTWSAGDTWQCATDGSTPCPTGTAQNTCALSGGVAPWMAPSIDPGTNMVYWNFGNVRSCASSQDGSTRPGTNLFSSSLVALDATTGAYKWHYQSVHHGQWDMDNTHVPVLADVTIGGQLRHVVYYGSKQGRTFVLDRTNGLPILGVQELAVPVDSRQQNWPTQPYPNQPPWNKNCMVYQNLGSAIPGDPDRAVPNYNGFQAQPDPANPGQLKLVYNPNSYIAADDPFVTSPNPPGQPKHLGCLNDPSWALPVLSTPSPNGGADWNGHAFSQDLGMYYVPMSHNAGAHDQIESSNGLRQLGGYQTGGIVAINGATNQIIWTKELGLDEAHGNTPLVTATDLLFLDQTDGYVVAMDAVTGNQLWKFQTGAAGSSGVITYMAGGQQYIAVLATGTGIPYSPPGGDTLWAFKLGGTAPYLNAAGAVVSGSSEAPSPPPLTIRRPVGNTAASTIVPANTILLARSNGTATGAADSQSTSAMVPSTLTVPVGTTVTFLNPGAGIGFNTPNAKPHCATQFFEGLFNFNLNPGQSATYTFNQAGEYFYNDCTDPRPTGKVVVTAPSTVVANMVKFLPNSMNLHPTTGVIPDGFASAVFNVPAGYVPTGGVSGISLIAPLTTAPITPVSVSPTGTGQLLVNFNKRDIANNVPTGSVPLTLSGIFTNNGVQSTLTTTVNVVVQK